MEVLDRFNGNGNALSWLFRAERYFTYLGFAEKDWLPIPSFYLDGEALIWFNWLFRNKQFHDWKHFKEKLFLHFRNHNFSALMGRLDKPSHACSTDLGYATVVPPEAQVSSFLDCHIPNSYGCHSALEDEASNTDHLFVERLVVVSPESHDPNTCLLEGKLSATSIDEVFEERLGDKENLVKSNYAVKDYCTEIENHIFDEMSHQSSNSEVFIIEGSNAKVLTNTSGSDLIVATSEEDEVLNEIPHSISFGEIRPSATRVSLLVPFAGREYAVSNKHLERDLPARFVDANSLDIGGTPKWLTDLVTFEDVYLASFSWNLQLLLIDILHKKILITECATPTSAMHLVEVLFEAENGKSIGRFTDQHILSQFSFDPGANFFIITISPTAAHLCLWDRGVSFEFMALTCCIENVEAHTLFDAIGKRWTCLFAKLSDWEQLGGVEFGVAAFYSMYLDICFRVSENIEDPHLDNFFMEFECGLPVKEHALAHKTMFTSLYIVFDPGGVNNSLCTTSKQLLIQLMKDLTTKHYDTTQQYMKTLFDNFSQGAGQTFQEFSPMEDDFEINCPVLSNELESESEDSVNTHLIIHAYRLPFIIGNEEGSIVTYEDNKHSRTDASQSVDNFPHHSDQLLVDNEVVESPGVWNGLLILDGIRLIHEHISIYLPFDPGESVPPHILFEHLNVHLDKSRYLPITLHSGVFSFVDNFEIPTELLESSLSNFNSLVVSFCFYWNVEIRSGTTIAEEEKSRTSVVLAFDNIPQRVPNRFMPSSISHQESWVIHFLRHVSILPHNKKFILANEVLDIETCVHDDILSVESTNPAWLEEFVFKQYLQQNFQCLFLSCIVLNRSTILPTSFCKDKCYMHLPMVLCAGGKLFDGTITRGCSSEKDHADSFRQLPNVVHNGHFMVVMHKELKLESSLLVSKDEYATQATIFGLYIFIDGVNDFLLGPWPSITNNAKDLVPTMLPEDTKQRNTSAKVIEQPWLQWEEATDKPIDHIVLFKLKQFRVIGNLMKPAIKVIAADFSEEEIKYLKFVFASMATNNSGTVTYERIKSGLARLASKLSEAKVLQLMQTSVLKFEGSFDWITLFLLQDKIHGATSHLARLISLRPNGDPNCYTVMLLLPRCQAELWEEKTNYPTVALHLLFVVDKVKRILLHILHYLNLEDKVLFEAGGIVVNLGDSVWDNGLEVCNKTDPLGSIGPGAKLRRGPMTKQPNKVLGHYIWDPGGIQGIGIMLQLWLKTVLLISSSESLPHSL